METVLVRFPPSRRVVACNPAGLLLGVGDCCVVHGERGPEFGIVARAAFDNPLWIVGEFPLAKVVRRATLEDEEAYSHKVAFERQAREFCLARIGERRLPMKLGQVERQLDGKKTVFYFTSEGRVDFRDLVRDLTSHFRMRIELRQIGARDDAGMQGGCGTCGRELCCSDWLKAFDPVSIRMAKAQGMSLNPAKISGICGRLMCCLKYEYDAAADSRRRRGGRATADQHDDSVSPEPAEPVDEVVIPMP